jgi:hypothetical protein
MPLPFGEGYEEVWSAEGFLFLRNAVLFNVFINFVFVTSIIILSTGIRVDNS